MSRIKCVVGYTFCSALRECRGNGCHTLCVQSIVCYTFACGAGVIYVVRGLERHILLQTAKVQKGVGCRQ